MQLNNTGIGPKKFPVRCNPCFCLTTYGPENVACSTEPGTGRQISTKSLFWSNRDFIMVYAHPISVHATSQALCTYSITLGCVAFSDNPKDSKTVSQTININNGKPHLSHYVSRQYVCIDLKV